MVYLFDKCSTSISIKSRVTVQRREKRPDQWRGGWLTAAIVAIQSYWFRENASKHFGKHDRESFFSPKRQVFKIDREVTWLTKVSLVAPWEMTDFVRSVLMETKLNNLPLEAHSWQLNGPRQTRHKSATSCVLMFAVSVLMKCLPRCRRFLLNFPLPCVE